MRRALALLAALAAASCADLHHATTNRAVLQLPHDGSPEIHYFIPPGATAVRLAEQSDHTDRFAREHFWSFDHRCFALQGATLRRLDPACGDPIVRLDWDAGLRDRMYPGIVRLQNGGVLVFTGYVEPLEADGSPAPWRAIAPSHGVVEYLDEKSHGAIRVDRRTFPGDPNGWVYLGPDRFVSHPVAQVLVDDGIALLIADEMLRVAPRLLEAFTERLEAPLPRRPIFYLTWINREAPGRGFQADVVDGPVVKFTLSGREWKVPPPDAVEHFRFVEAHEFAHFWNRLDKPSTPWITEGGADLLGWAALHRAGIIDDRQLADHVEAAFNECAILAGGYAWHAIPGRDRGRYPYACGATLQLVAIALARRDASLDAFGLWRGILAGGEADETATRAFLRRISPRAAAALDPVLESDRPLAASLDDAILAAGLRARTVDPQTIGPMLRHTLADRTFMPLMLADCGGNGGFRSDARELVTFAIEGCRSFRGEMRIATVEGAPLIRQPVEALRRANSACAASHRVRIATEDNQQMRVACDASTPLPRLDALRHFDPAQVAQLLDAGNQAPSASR